MIQLLLLINQIRFVYQQLLFYQRESQKQFMNAWNLCDEQLLVANYEVERKLIDRTYSNPYLAYFPYSRDQPHHKQPQRKIQKTSLKRSPNSGKLLCFNNTKKQEIMVQPPPAIQRGTSQNFNFAPFKPQQKSTPKQIIYPPSTFKHFNPEVSQAYYTNFRQPVALPRTTMKVNLKINYINPLPIIIPQQNIQPKRPQNCQNQSRVLRRMNTEPSRLQNVCYQDEGMSTKKQESVLSKSMQYEEKVFENQLKQRQKLNQIKCTRAESIPDSREDEDQISIVISPFSEDETLSKYQFTLQNSKQYFSTNIQQTHVFHDEVSSLL